MMDSKTPTKIRDIFSFQRVGERNERKKRKRATNDKSTIFR